jgi:hypothetical protein
MKVLEWANTMGAVDGTLNPITKMQIGRGIEDLESVISPAEKAALTKISESQKFWQRQFPTTTGATRVGVKKIYPLASKDLAMAARMFLPSADAIDDVFNIHKDIKKLRVQMAVMQDGLVASKLLIDNYREIWLTNENVLKGSDETFRYMKIAAKDTFDTIFKKTNTSQLVVNSIDEVLHTKMLPAIGTAQKAADTWFLRIAGKTTEVGVKAGLRLVGVSAPKATKWATKAATGVKMAGKGFAKYVFWPDTLIWAATGMYDLAFVEDVEGTYLGEHWGFSPLGYLIDEAVDYLLPDETQELIADRITQAVVFAAREDSIQELVYSLASFFINEIHIEVLPFDLFLEMGFETPLSLLSMMPNDFDPMLILEVGIYLIVAKLVITHWIQPAWSGVVKLT